MNIFQCIFNSFLLASFPEKIEHLVTLKYDEENKLHADLMCIITNV